LKLKWGGTKSQLFKTEARVAHFKKTVDSSESGGTFHHIQVVVCVGIRTLCGQLALASFPLTYKTACPILRQVKSNAIINGRSWHTQNQCRFTENYIIILTNRMERRKTKNLTGLARIEGIPYHDAWVGFICLSCGVLNNIRIGLDLLAPKTTYKTAKWECSKCGYVHSENSDLPFENWSKDFTVSESIRAQRFWEAFFRIATEHPESYWKQCNVCGRILPFAAFSKHSGWGPLERQMECRSCKGAINAVLNPKRTKEQLHESSVRRRIADLLLEGEHETIAIADLFKRFDNRCFKTKQPLNINKRETWAIDHILPSRWLYPLTKENAALLSTEANNNKRDKWPSEFYTNNELIELAKLTGADLGLLAGKTPVINANINVDKCVKRYLQVRERSHLPKRINELRKILEDYSLVNKLSPKNIKLLGFTRVNLTAKPNTDVK